MTMPLYGWRDLRSAITAADIPASSAPTPTAFGPTGSLKRYAFAVNDYVGLDFHVDHDYWPGSTAYIHVHWTTNGTSTNTVKWQLTYTIAKGHNQANFGTDTVITLEEAAAGTAWRHMVTEDATGFSLIEPDTLLHVDLKRITNGGTENTDAVFGLFVDIHYQTMQYATPYRTPNFYTGP